MSELNQRNCVSQRSLVAQPKASNEEIKMLGWRCQVGLVRGSDAGVHRMHNLRGTSACSDGLRGTAAPGDAAPASRSDAGGAARRGDSI